MKKAIFAIALLANVAFSQGLAFKKGQSALDLGFNVTYFDGIGAMLGWDVGAINNMFSFGADVMYHRYTPPHFLYSSVFKEHYSYLNPNFRFAFHPFGIPAVESGEYKWLSKFDPYAVLKMGPRFRWYKYESKVFGYNSDSKDLSVGFHWGLSGGCRFYVQEKFHLFVEGGTGSWIFGLGFNL